MTSKYFECSSCKKAFTTKQNLARHINTIHLLHTELFKCNECNHICSRKYDLDRHVKLKHSNNYKLFVCNKCPKTFGKMPNLMKHDAVTHTDHDVEFSNIDEIFTTSTGDANQFEEVSFDDKCDFSCAELKLVDDFVCNGCSRKFSRKYSLKRHIQTCQNRALEEDIFICGMCGMEYKKKKMLKQHIRRRHSDGLCDVRCAICGMKMKGRCRKTALARHVNEFHVGVSATGPLKCALCGNRFSTRENIWYHITGDAHNIQFNHEHFTFATIEEFKEWKRNVEKRIIGFFRKKNTRHFTQHSVCRFVCHRSGSYQPKTFDRKRRVKLQGSKKMGAFCPAEIILYQRKGDGVCRVAYVSTHLGHNVCHANELAHVYLTEDERVQIASKISDGVPYDRILAEDLESTDKSAVNAVHLLNRRDLLNISRDFNVKVEKSEKNAHAEKLLFDIDFDDIIKLHEKSILFYKKAGEKTNYCDVVLEKDDIFVVLMTEDQKVSVRRYGHKLISIDGTLDAEDVGFSLQSMLVIDDYCEAIPVAFAISNRDDEHIANLFLQCLKVNVGILSTSTLMCSFQSPYFNYWLRIMGNAQHRPFCKLKPNDAWRQGLKEISNAEKRKFVRGRLRQIFSNLDVAMFHADLNEFLSINDPDLDVFMAYFKAEFSGNLENWALCYRRNTDANIVAKSVNRSLKYLLGKVSKVKSLTACLSIVSNYLTLYDRDLKRKEIRGKVSTKLQELRRRHNEFKKDDHTVAVENFPEVGWYVSVSRENSDSADVHLVQKSDIECGGCKLLCEECNICIHQYKCTCADNTVKSNMCQHIHALSTYFPSSSMRVEHVEKEETFVILDGTEDL